MSSSLSGIDVAKRRQLAATLGLFSVLFVAVGAVAATGATTLLIKAFVVIAIVAALLLALMGWGVAHSVRQDVAERRLDDAVEEVIVASPVRTCDCGLDHDPTELHVVGDQRALRTDDPCARDGHGIECTHTCDTCVLAALRASPTRQREDGLSRPSPRPRSASDRRPSPVGGRGRS